MLLLNKIITVQQQDKDMFFFFPLVEVYCVSVYVNIVLTAGPKWREPCATQAKKEYNQTPYALIVHV